MEYPEEIPLAIPSLLQQHLEDDCYWIHSRNKLVSLPSETSVSTLLRVYYQHSLTNAPQDTNFCLLAEVLDGLKVYFDFMLSDHLLYCEEKNQFKQLCDTESFGHAIIVNKCPSDCYGVEHLLRLFVRLPYFLSRAHLPNAHTHTLHTHINDLLEYLTNEEDLFSEEHYHDNGVPHSNGVLDPTAIEQ